MGKAGFSTVLATDVEPLCCETFRRNFPEVPFLTKRIGEIDRADLVEALGQRFEDVDLLAGVAVPAVLQEPLLSKGQAASAG